MYVYVTDYVFYEKNRVDKSIKKCYINKVTNTVVFV